MRRLPRRPAAGRLARPRRLPPGRLVCLYDLGTRLLPERLGVFDSIAGYRLAEPVGYWNALGLFAATGILVALGLVVRARTLVARAACGSTLPLLAATLYLTARRRAAVRGGRVRRRRRGRVARGRADDARRAARGGSREGHRLALVLAALAVGSAILCAAFGGIERRVAPSPALRRAFATVLAAAVVAALSFVFVAYGSPSILVQRGYDAFVAPPPHTGGDLNARLFSFSGSGRIYGWESAWRQFLARPLVGHGAGSFEQWWLRDRELGGKIRDAHSLYLETLAELGIVGLCLLLLALLIPVYAVVRARWHPLVPAASGAYIAYLIRAGVDWDWEMPAVTLAALTLAAAIVATGPAEAKEPRPLSPRARYAGLAAVLALGAVALIGLVGNMAISSSAEAARDGDFTRSKEQARKAQRWAPWSPEPWQLLGREQLAEGELAAARASFERAIEHAPSRASGRSSRASDQSSWFPRRSRDETVDGSQMARKPLA